MNTCSAFIKFAESKLHDKDTIHVLDTSFLAQIRSLNECVHVLEAQDSAKLSVLVSLLDYNLYYGSLISDNYFFPNPSVPL